MDSKPPKGKKGERLQGIYQQGQEIARAKAEKALRDEEDARREGIEKYSAEATRIWQIGLEEKWQDVEHGWKVGPAKRANDTFQTMKAVGQNAENLRIFGSPEEMGKQQAFIAKQDMDLNLRSNAWQLSDAGTRVFKANNEIAWLGVLPGLEAAQNEASETGRAVYRFQEYLKRLGIVEGLAKYGIGVDPESFLISPEANERARSIQSDEAALRKLNLLMGFTQTMKAVMENPRLHDAIKIFSTASTEEEKKNQQAVVIRMFEGIFSSYNADMDDPMTKEIIAGMTRLALNMAKPAAPAAPPAK